MTKLPANGHASSQDEQQAPMDCFVITPIEDPRSDSRRQADALLNEAIRPVIEEQLELNVTAAHERSDAGRITPAVIQHLLMAELVIADLTGLNANVMYELALRHAKGRPVVPVASTGTSLPFDIMAERTVFYEATLYGLDKLKSKLEYAARGALNNDAPYNPVAHALKDVSLDSDDRSEEHEDQQSSSAPSESPDPTESSQSV